MRSKSGLSEGAVVSIDSTTALFVSTGVFTVSGVCFLLQESNALGIVASTPQARMAEEYRAKARP